MPTELTDILLSGELEGINIDGTDAEDAAAKISDLTTAIADFVTASEVVAAIQLRLTNGDQTTIYIGGTTSGDAATTSDDVDAKIAANTQVCKEYELDAAVGTGITPGQIALALATEEDQPVEFEPFIVTATNKSYLIVLVGEGYQTIEMALAVTP